MNERINKIKEVLVSKGVSQKELAAKMEKSENTVSNWCSNRVQPHLKELQKISQILDIDIRELLVANK